MNSVIASHPLVAPHLLQHPHLSPIHSPSSHSHSMSGRKRKADDDANLGEGEDRMSSSPSASPAISSRGLTSVAQRNSKRLRTDISGRPLCLPRMLETLGADDMRNILKTICDRHPEIGAEVVATAPRPTVPSALRVLTTYESTLRESFPFGGRASSDYAYNRVRQPLANLLDALQDYTPHFLPPHEQQTATSLQYLDEATHIVHRLPEWDSFHHNRHKHEAYEEIAKAWALVIKEAAKRGGGIQLQYGGWDVKLSKHNETSGGRMDEAMVELRNSLGWMGGPAGAGQGSSSGSNDPASIRQQLLSGSYGANLPVRVGPW